MNLESGVLQVHIEDIIPNRFQPRLNFDEQGLKELSDSIKEHGIIQPLVLRKLGDKYEIIAGERRYKAAVMAGLTTVPAVIANIDDNRSAEVALVENVQRRDLTAIEEARSYKSLLDKGYLTQEQLAKRMGLSQPAIANKLRLLNLDEEVQQALLDEKISERHARTLLSLEDKNAQKEWLHRIINERLTVRELDIELKKLKELNQTIENAIAEPETLDTLEPLRGEQSNKEQKRIEDDFLSKDLFSGNKFFDFNSLSSPKEETYLKEEDNKEKAIFEIFDAPVAEKKGETEEAKETKATENTFTNTPLNTDFDRNPTNKFFTPVTEPTNPFSKEEKEETIDPMDAVANLEKEVEKPIVKEEEQGLKGAINSIRDCIKALGNKGFFINVEEIDFDSNYQINIKINKDN